MELAELLRRLDPVLMNPSRLLIVALLYLFGPRKESEIVRALGVSWASSARTSPRLSGRAWWPGSASSRGRATGPSSGSRGRGESGIGRS